MKINSVTVEFKGQHGPVFSKITFQNGELFIQQTVSVGDTSYAGRESFVSRKTLKEDIEGCNDPDTMRQLKMIQSLFDILSPNSRDICSSCGDKITFGNDYKCCKCSVWVCGDCAHEYDSDMLCPTCALSLPKGS